MSVGYQELTQHGKVIKDALKDAAQDLASAARENVAETDKLKLVELILIYGPEKVQAALDCAGSKTTLKIPEKKVSRVPGL